MSVPSAPKGTRDFYPENMAMRQFIFDSWNHVCKTYGFEQYDGPMFENLELFTQKSGAEIEKQLYAFKDKGGRDVALRPEMTPTLARMVAAKGTALKRPVRWYSIVDLFRYERMQKGRLREFTQLNMDILGIADPTADADLIAAVVAMMRDLGLDSTDFSVRISSRQLLEQAFLALGIPQSSLANVYAALDKRHKIGEEAFAQELQNACGTPELATKVAETLNVAAIEDFDRITPDLEAVDTLKKLFALLDAYGISEFIEFDVGIVRGLAYYTGIVFEVFDKARTLRAIAGGGRYDKLVSLYGGPDTPAVGFAAGDVVLGELLKEKGIGPTGSIRSDAFVASFDRNNFDSAIAMCQSLRNTGIRSEYSLKAVAIGKQMKAADASGARFVVFVGGDEAAEGNVKVHDMATGNEQTIPTDSVVELIHTGLQ